jgi:hypothetical protein
MISVPWRRWLAALVACVTAMAAPGARAQDIEPRAYSNAPIGYNFLVTGFAYTRGGLAFNSTLALTNPNLDTVSAVAAYARVIELGGQSAKLEATVPFTSLSGTADYRGEQVSRDIHGFANPSFRLSANLYGAPAATFYTTNEEFWNGNSLSQDPLYAARGHVIYGFTNGVWLSVDATWYAGGRTTFNGTLNDDLLQNWRLGGTLAFPTDRNFSIKVYASSGVSDRTGNSFDLLGWVLQYRWLGDAC